MSTVPPSASEPLKAIEARPAVGAYICEPTAKFADYWKRGAWNEPNRENALTCMEQAVNAWKNLAYDLARSAHYYRLQQTHQDAADVSHEQPRKETHVGRLHDGLRDEPASPRVAAPETESLCEEIAGEEGPENLYTEAQFERMSSLAARFEAAARANVGRTQAEIGKEIADKLKGYAEVPRDRQPIAIRQLLDADDATRSSIAPLTIQCEGYTISSQGAPATVSASTSVFTRALKLFSVLITDSYMPNKRTAKWRQYLVAADSEAEAERVLREERPTSFMYARSIEIKDHSDQTVWLLDNGYINRAGADRAYERVNAAKTEGSGL